MKFCGIDENGLGPFLGPLIITAYETERISDVQDVKDSKKIFSRKEKDFEFIEKFFVNEFGKVEDLYELFEKSELSQAIGNICPFSPETFCFSRIRIPSWGNFPISDKKRRKSNISFILACPGLLHLKVRDFGTKFRANAYFLCLLALKSESQMIFCGKSGYKKSYLEELKKAMSDINLETEAKVVKESEEESIYEIQGQNKRIHFVRDADLKFPEVAYASIIGKYLRELCMLSITRFAFQDSKFPISGYGSKKKMKHVVKRILDNLGTRFGVFDEKTARNCIERNY